MNKSAMVARHLLIHGKVQGVYYRASAVAEATRLGVSGWVRNRSSGSVEAVICGSDEQIEAFIQWAQEGPPNADVRHIEVSAWDEPVSAGFRQLPTV